MSTELAEDIRARRFITARLRAEALAEYPGAPPQSLTEAYSVQDEAIRLWPDRVAGWKVGRINPPWDGLLGSDRLAGPVFASDVSHAGASPVDTFVFEGGFGAVEGEIVIVCAGDAPPQKTAWTTEEASELIGDILIGAEIASSPFPGINDLGPLVTISDFGNNNGLVLGPQVAGWRQASPSDWGFTTRIDGEIIGRADASAIPGGPIESFRALLEICAARGMPLRKGMYVSTGAVTGVHTIRAGQTASVEMDGYPEINLRLLPMGPSARRIPGGSASSGTQ
ncbi:2-keto-4-pentenoate hydratase [Hyphomonas sp.]|uniref:2-keto-4-pentenoate hydratase n=1 Tax=Hyphomonas sp. TaxID=87 RepID=UPI00391ACDF8